MNRLLMFGLGYVGSRLTQSLRSSGWNVDVIVRSDNSRAETAALGARAIDLWDEPDLEEAVAGANALLIVAPPADGACPAHDRLAPVLSQIRPNIEWVGYLSSTAVYGDQRGAWTYEDSPMAGESATAVARIRAERAWSELCSQRLGVGLTTFRVAGIYGPGRSVLDRLRAGSARRIEKHNHVLSRIHVDDLVQLLCTSLRPGTPPGVYNVCDDEPAATMDVVGYAAQLLAIEAPPIEPVETARMSASAARYYAESRRISNSLAKLTFVWRPRYPSYREGLLAILAAERAAT